MSPPQGSAMPSCSDSVISSRFKRRLPGGRHDLLFKVCFGSDAAAARVLRVSKMTIWRWRHDRAPLPSWVGKILADLVQGKVVEAHLAQTEFNYFLREPRRPRPLSGCCKPKNLAFRPER